MSFADKLVSRLKAEFAGQIISTVAGGILVVLLARLLGSDEYGLLFLAISIITIAKLFGQLGIGKSAGRYIAEYKTEDPSQLRHILRLSLLLNLAVIIVVAGGLGLTHRLLASVVGEPELTPLLLLGVLFVGFGALVHYVRLVLQGYEQIELAALVKTTDRVLRLAFAVGFVLAGYGAFGALAGYVLSFATVAVCGLAFLYIRYYRSAETGPRESGLGRRIAEYTVPLTVTSSADVLNKHVDTVLVGFFVNPVAVAYYTISKQLVQFVSAPLAALGFSLSPSFASKKAAGETDEVTAVYQESLFYALLLYIPGAAGLILLAEPIIELVFSAEYSGAVPVLQVFALVTVLYAVTKTTSNGLDFLGRAKERAIIYGITTVINTVLNIILIPQYGAAGAAFATVITYSMYTFSVLYLMNEELGLDTDMLLKRVVVVVGITAVMSLVVYQLAEHATDMFSLLLVISVGIAVWFVQSVAFGFLEPRKIVARFV